MDADDGKTIFAGTDGDGVLKSKDGGNSWSPSGLDNSTLEALVIDPKNAATLYAATSIQGGLYKSTDGGANWSTINDSLTNQYVYAGTSDQLAGGLFKSSDGGQNWISVNRDLTNLNIRALALDPFNSARIYLGTFGGGSFVYGKINLAIPWIPLLLLDD